MLQIRVFLSKSSDTPVFERILDCHQEVSFDFQVVLKAMRQLFGNKCIVDFKMELL